MLKQIAISIITSPFEKKDWYTLVYNFNIAKFYLNTKYHKKKVVQAFILLANKTTIVNKL